MRRGARARRSPSLRRCTTRPRSPRSWRRGARFRTSRTSPSSTRPSTRCSPPRPLCYVGAGALAREWGIRRYGFHGLSVQWAARARDGLARLVVCHLGGGCSVTRSRRPLGRDDDGLQPAGRGADGDALGRSTGDPAAPSAHGRARARASSRARSRRSRACSASSGSSARVEELESRADPRRGSPSRCSPTASPGRSRAMTRARRPRRDSCSPAASARVRAGPAPTPCARSHLGVDPRRICEYLSADRGRPRSRRRRSPHRGRARERGCRRAGRRGGCRCPGQRRRSPLRSDPAAAETNSPPPPGRGPGIDVLCDPRRAARHPPQTVDCLHRGPGSGSNASSAVAPSGDSKERRPRSA